MQWCFRWAAVDDGSEAVDGGYALKGVWVTYMWGWGGRRKRWQCHEGGGCRVMPVVVMVEVRWWQRWR